jgi:PAS domain S-box-containing protein
MTPLAFDLVAQIATIVRYADRRRPLAYGMAAGCVALGVGSRLALQGLDVTIVPFATLFPAIAAAALVGGAGPGLLALLFCTVAALALLDAADWPSAAYGLAGLVNLGLLVLTGGMLVVLAALARSALLRLAVGEDRLSLAISSTGLGIWDVEGASGARRWSAEFRAILGLDAAVPADPQLFESLIHPDDRGWVSERYRAAYAPGSDGRYHAEFRIRRADDGAERWVATTGRVYFDPAGGPVRAAGTMVDITPRRLTESAWRESEERYRTLLETAPDAVHVHRDGVIIFANRQAATLFGAERAQDLIGCRALDFVDPDSLEIARSRTARLRSPGQRNLPVQLTMRRLDGRNVVVEANSAAVVLDGKLAVQAVVRDITERLRGEAALRESENRFRLAAAAVQGIVYDLDLATGDTWRSEGLARIVGIEPRDAPPAHSWWEGQIHPDDLARVQRDTRLLDDPDVVHLDREYRVRHAQGRWVHLHDRSFVVRDSTGQATRLIGVSTDITERKAAEARQALMAREVDHRARNALSIVLSLVRLTRVQDPQDFARAIEDRVGALARVHTLLAENHWLDADLAMLLEEELAPYRDAATITTAGPAVRLSAKAMQPLALVLHELTTNAAKHGAFAAPGGRLDLRWSLESDGTLHLSWQETGGPPILAAPAHRGFGLTLIDASVRCQLGGTAELAWEPAGLICRLTVAAGMLAENALRMPEGPAAEALAWTA